MLFSLELAVNFPFPRSPRKDGFYGSRKRLTHTCPMAQQRAYKARKLCKPNSNWPAALSHTSPPLYSRTISIPLSPPSPSPSLFPSSLSLSLSLPIYLSLSPLPYLLFHISQQAYRRSRAAFLQMNRCRAKPRSFRWGLSLLRECVAKTLASVERGVRGEQL